MSSAARIEELQKKFDENPRRYFAPLANECRKAGELDAAIAICRAHLPQQPGHMSGHIVYGQALYESGEIAEARTVFETALGLDPENLIALRHMGDIAARDGDLDAARQWYKRVLETDPRNEEIQALIAGLGPDAGAATVEGLPALIDPELMAVAAEATDAGESPFAGSDSLLMPTSLGDHEDAAGAEEFSLDGFEATSFEAGDPSPVETPVATPVEAPSWDMPGIDEPSWRESPAGELAAADGPADALAPDLLAHDAQAEAGADADFMMIDGSETAVPEAVSATPTPEADAFATETMAELYLRQGYHEQAIGVYRQLVAQNPTDARLRERLASAEREFEAAATPIADTVADFETGDALDELETVDAASSVESLPGLPEALDPELLAAAAEATGGSDVPSPISAAATSAGPTIREFLAALAQGRAAAAHASQAVPSEPLEFGEVAEVVDVAGELAAADALEGIGEAGMEQPSAPAASPLGGPAPAPLPDLDDDRVERVTRSAQSVAGEPAPGLDALFGATEDARDSAAADVLARAYGAGPEPEPSAADSQPLPDPQADPLSGRPARPAGNDLSLDSVFGTPRQPGASRNTGGFSFDQFFADGAVKTPREESPEPASAGDGDEDLEQFNSWLHGLKNQ